MRVLLLGATGLLGRNVLNRLLDRGCEVTALVRNSHGIRDVSSSSLAVVEGSLSDMVTLRDAARDCDAVINCAGTTDMSLLNFEDYLPMNAELCRYLAVLVETTDTKTVVHVSTTNTIGYGTKGHPADENEPMREPFASSMYALSKREGEQYLETAAANNPDAHVVILNPGFMVGPWDSKPSSGRLLLAGYRKPLMAAPPGGKSFVDVRDVADAAISALTKGRNGERYLITGEELSLKDFYRRQASVCGYRQLYLVLPSFLVAAAGVIGDLLRSLHVRTQLSSCNVRQLSVMEFYTSRKATVELGFSPSPIDVAIKGFFDWHNSQKT